ncbi:LAME_0E07184g1_1 [Lachancea meyersii CBS 8951]|uniref:LAME_0E07184g1_1 n=1 Tax=Lachancea meyersii CBS 8951 TaxID=1266667 RepID=A0A1G4JII9_9SACH|nr:LAME_0E07184g1_1 [Lachancea meyersii CBS 8951]
MSTYSRYLSASTLAPIISVGAETHQRSPPARRKRSFDDLLLPSLPFETPHCLYHDSTYLLQRAVIDPLPQNKRARTAPASPVGVDHLTPKASPLSLKASINYAPIAPSPSSISAASHPVSNSQQLTGSQHYNPPTSSSIPKESFYSASSLTLASLNQRNRSESDSDDFPNISQTYNCGPLPSLKHLHLLPNPNIQEHAYRYPDTSEKTPLWRESLINWCKRQNYHDYVQINKELRECAPNASGLNMLANVASLSRNVPSILSPPDEFLGLSNATPRWEVVTPPMSPRSACATSKNSPVFTPAVSDKLVQTVKERRTKAHKKTNSFKAREMKKLLNDRDILSIDSKGKVAKARRSRTRSVPSSPQQFVIKLGGLTSPKSLTKSSPRDFVHGQEVLRAELTPVRSRTPPRTQTLMINGPHTPNTSISTISFPAGADADADTDAEVTRTPITETPVAATRKMSSPKRSSARTCISCLATDSPCWRPSWTNKKQDQLCNSCGLRYKKTQTRCLNESCRKIPSKGELAIMKANGVLTRISPDGNVSRGLGCLFCNSIVETKDWHVHR